MTPPLLPNLERPLCRGLPLVATQRDYQRLGQKVGRSLEETNNGAKRLGDLSPPFPSLIPPPHPSQGPDTKEWICVSLTRAVEFFFSPFIFQAAPSFHCLAAGEIGLYTEAPWAYTAVSRVRPTGEDVPGAEASSPTLSALCPTPPAHRLPVLKSSLPSTSRPSY